MRESIQEYWRVNGIQDLDNNLLIAGEDTTEKANEETNTEINSEVKAEVKPEVKEEVVQTESGKYDVLPETGSVVGTIPMLMLALGATSLGGILLKKKDDVA